uniref:Uncharacterized protein n=1 Tax=Myoviridae sp. ctKFg29 TaxID=2827675 RepID=A0A8S5RXK5_9CAUD|nr:MAG TPA: hypothetical protein [Myoviridae sp. ctKFg29]
MGRFFRRRRNQRRGYAGGQRRARDAREMELRDAGANDAGAQSHLLQKHIGGCAGRKARSEP